MLWRLALVIIGGYILSSWLPISWFVASLIVAGIWVWAAYGPAIHLPTWGGATPAAAAPARGTGGVGTGSGTASKVASTAINSTVAMVVLTWAIGVPVYYFTSTLIAAGSPLTWMYFTFEFCLFAVTLMIVVGTMWRAAGGRTGPRKAFYAISFVFLFASLYLQDTLRTAKAMPTYGASAGSTPDSVGVDTVKNVGRAVGGTAKLLGAGARGVGFVSEKAAEAIDSAASGPRMLQCADRGIAETGPDGNPQPVETDPELSKLFGETSLIVSGGCWETHIQLPAAGARELRVEPEMPLSVRLWYEDGTTEVKTVSRTQKLAWTKPLTGLSFTAKRDTEIKIVQW